jgi:hypothetical protein
LIQLILFIHIMLIMSKRLVGLDGLKTLRL